MERTEFLHKLIVRGSIAALFPGLILQSCEDDSMDDFKPSGGSDPPGNITIDLSDPMYAALQSEGGSVSLPSRSIIIINKGNNDYTALSSVCTHQACTVSYNKTTNTLPCPCHGSLFDINGSVLNGPAGSPLRRYTISIDMNTLTIHV